MKKYVKLLLLLVMVIVSILSIGSCGSNGQEPNSTEKQLTLSEFTLSLTPGESELLVATLTVDGAEVEEFDLGWSSSNPNVATVVNGLITAINPGSAIITAKSGELTAECGVIVGEPISLTLSETTLDLFEWESTTLNVIASDNGTHNYQWTSSNPDVATVEDGVVTAVSQGSAIITVTNGQSNATCVVNVYEEVVKLVLSRSFASINVGDELELTASMSDGSIPKLEWESSNNAIASVADGKVTGVVAGNATITVIAGDYYASCEIIVNDVCELFFEDIELEETLFVGDTVELNIVLKKNGEEQDISNATITGSGFTVAGNIITLNKSGLIDVTVDYNGNALTRQIPCYAAIATKEQFLAISNNLAGYYKLTKNLDLGGVQVKSFSSYYGHQADANVAFTGIFDGQGHSVSNFETVYNTTWSNVDRDRSIFGYLAGGAIIKDVSFLNVKSADKAYVVASYVEEDGGCLIENVYVEASYLPNFGVNISANEVGAFVVGKLFAGNEMRNCVLVLTIQPGIRDKMENLDPPATTGRWAFNAAMVGRNEGVMENCFTLYNAEKGQELDLIYANKGTTKNCGLYTDPTALWTYANLSGFNEDIWSVIENSIPHIRGTFNTDLTVNKATANVNAGSTYQIYATCESAITYECTQEGVTVDKTGLVSIDENVPAGTVVKIKVLCLYDATQAKTVTITVLDKIQVSAQVNEIIISDIVADGSQGVVDLGVVVKVDGQKVDYTLVSSDTSVVKIVNGKVVAVSNGNANVCVTYGESILLTIPATLSNVYIPIYTVQDFENIAKNPNAYYKLMNDLDFEGKEFSAFSGWASAFDGSTAVTAPFTGIFDGNGYTIKNIVPKHDQGRHSITSTDASIFGVIGNGGIIRNLAISAHIKYRGGVVASMVLPGGTIENCLVECIVEPSLIDFASNKQFGGIVYRSQNKGLLQNNIVILKLLKDSSGATANTAWMSGIAHVGYGISRNNYSVVLTGETLNAITTTNTTTQMENNASFTSMVDFYTNANLSSFDLTIWTLSSTSYPHLKHTSAEVVASETTLQVPAGSNAVVDFTSDLFVIVNSNTEGVTYENGCIKVAGTVAPGTVATIIVYCAYDHGQYVTITVNVADAVSATTGVSDITNDKYVLGTTATTNLGINVMVNGVATQNYTVETSNPAVVTVANGVASLVGEGTAEITISYNGYILKTIPVSVIAYVGVYDLEDFENISKNMSGKYMLMNDLDFKGATHYAFGSWAYGHDNAAYGFTGIFDGNGYAIKNVVIGVDNRHANVQTDASIFGTIQANGVVRNLSVLNATVTNRGGVIASGIANNGLVENCFVECNVVSLTAVASGNDFGPIAFRAQLNSKVYNCIAVIKVAEGVDTTYLGAIVGYPLSKNINNCQAIVISGQQLKTHTSEHGTYKPVFVNTAVYTSVEAFYDNVNLTNYTSALWHFEEGFYPYLGNEMQIAVEEEAVEVPAGQSLAVKVNNVMAYTVNSSVNGVSYENGQVVVADSVEAGTEATLTFTCLYTGNTATITVTVTEIVEITTAVDSITNERFVLNTTAETNLGINVTLNGVATQNYTVETSNPAVVTVANGVASLVGEGTAEITISYKGIVLKTIPVSVIAYVGVYSIEDFDNISKNMSGKYMLMNDLDFEGATHYAFASWDKSTTGLLGIFDGNGYAIKNVVVGVNRNDKNQTDASIFGVVLGGGVVRNLSVLNATVTNRGGVIASAVMGGGVIENCFVECNVVSLTGVGSGSDFGPIVFRAQTNSTVRDCITVVKVAEGVDTTYLGAIVGYPLSNGKTTVENCQAIVISGQQLNVYTSKHTSYPPVINNTAVYTSLNEFYANVNRTNYTSALWHFAEGFYPYLGNEMQIAVEEDAVEVPAGQSVAVKVNNVMAYTVSSNVEGVSYANGGVVVADSVAAGTEATLTFTCLYTGNTVTITVTVTANS